MIPGPGTTLGGYLLERQLGSGGMGTVYLARHPALPRHDALKVLWPHLAADPEYRARFEREANIAAALDHPNIVSVLNKGEDRGCLWIALQYVNGTDADSALAREPATMTPDRVLHIITEIGKGLDHAHGAGLLHRDIKPANFLLTSATPGEERVLLADFGIAKPTEDATQLTKTGTFLATLAYASPEQLSGHALDPRSDIYSLGCSFYRLITGQNPYPATQPLNVMMAHINDPVPRVTTVRPDLPRALDDVLTRVLAKSPADRYPSCAEFIAAAAAALGTATVRSYSHPGARVDAIRAADVTEVLGASPGQRNVAWKALGAVVACLLIVVAVVYAVEKSGRTSSPGMPGTTNAVAELQDPCRLLTEESRIDAQTPKRYTSDHGKSCTWEPKGADGIGVAIDLLTSGIPAVSQPKYEPIRIAGAIDGQQLNFSSSNCAVLWPTGFGHAKLSVTGKDKGKGKDKGAADDACAIAVDLAGTVSAKLHR
ncbi:serine/threonine-protein kinase [Nocardia sp. NPDC058058]|uniref:serine/threonine-protein kinase n=1 Tax=Nocardia sp. NPDC058058 TaxID=3346317 RepID=UPI0036DD0593